MSKILGEDVTAILFLLFLVFGGCYGIWEKIKNRKKEKVLEKTIKPFKTEPKNKSDKSQTILDTKPTQSIFEPETEPESKISVEPKKVKTTPKQSTINRDVIEFDYVDYHGNPTRRKVRVREVDETYLEGYDLNRRDTRTFKLERIGDEIIELETGLISTKEDWLRDNYDIELDDLDDDFKEYLNLDSKYNDPTLEVCFTGFKKADREELELDAELTGDFIVRKSVTQNLDILVCGSNAGPTKKAQAERQGVLILSEDEFRETYLNE
ncbi:BRCT domain-containing protein [Phocoenobacter uteri]|nr:WYL domain-containing protein [Phocoenobacter uteri]